MPRTPPMDSRTTNPALPLFWNTYGRGWLSRLWRRLTRRPDRLLELDETLCCTEVTNRSYEGTQAVDVELIRGTEGKAAEFDADFHPLKESSRTRWLSVALERLRGHDLPPVDLVFVDGVYYVQDGHHRISVARSMGQRFIDAEVIRMEVNRLVR